MKKATKDKLLEAWAYCDEEEKSTEFMIEYMQDFAGVDLECVINFLKKTTDDQRNNWYLKNQKK
jgi:hypothetical protein